jgi:hypothetical protein
MLLAVNGTLMRGLELNQTLLELGGVFIRVARTAPLYRLWSINDQYPAMLRVNTGGAPIVLELWEINHSGLVGVVENEPPGLALGFVSLEDGSQVLGIVAEPFILEGMAEITAYGDWRVYMQQNNLPAAQAPGDGARVPRDHP